MKKNYFLVPAVLIIVLTIQVSGQDVRYLGEDADKIIKSSQAVYFQKFSKQPVFATFGEGSIWKSSQVSALLTTALEPGPDDHFVKFAEEQDHLGFRHQKYQQYYKKIKVENGQYLVHIKEGKIISINGFWIDRISLGIVPGISKEEAIKAALADCGALRYKWQMKEEESRIKSITHDANSTFYPDPELVIISKNFDYEKREMHLCYKFDVYADAPLSRNWYYVDASTGKIIARENRICTSNVNATGNTLYNGIKPMVTDSFANNNYRLRETGRGLGIETYDLNTGTNYGAAVDFTNNSNFWNVSTNFDRAAYDAHWGAENTYDYYQQIFGRNGIDNAGMKLLSYVHYGVNINDAFWDGTEITYGDGNQLAGGCNAFPAIDICGHEFTHGITRLTAGLLYVNESGALNESFSDIFGTNVEFHSSALVPDWLIGEDIMVTAGTAIRSMSNPNQYSQPDTYLGTNWYTGLSDNGGVHKNSGVQNFWYYLLSQGGSGINDNGDNYIVTGIGRTKAEQIAYRNLSIYMTSFSNYADARRNSIQAAQDIYGPCSPEVISTTNAWYAVGVGPAYSSNITAGFQVSGNYSCSVPFTVNFTNTSVNATNAWWNFGDGTTSTNYHPSHTYTLPGTYSVKLVSASSCSASDSVLQTSIITITTPNAPTVSGASSCGPAALHLSAIGNGTLQWYTTASGGNSFHTGNNFLTPVLQNTNTYYVESQLAGNIGFCGKADSAGGSNGPWGGYYEANMIFDVYQACTLKTVKVYSTSAGTRNITLRSSVGTILQNYSVNLPLGESTIPLNFPINPGTGYRLGGDTLFFTLNIGNVTFPYNLNGIASITGSSVTTSTTPLYLFFYNWQFETAPCISLRTPVTATINAIPNASITANGAITFCQGNEVTLTASLGNAYLWSNGASSQSIVVNNSGNYMVTVTGSGGCQAMSNTVNVIVNYPPATPGSISGATNGVCINTTKSYSVPLVNNVSYLWTPPPGATIISGQGTRNIQVNFGNTFNGGDLSVFAYNNCGNSAIKKIKINSVPGIPGTITGPVYSNCSQNSIYSISKITGATSYTWSTNIAGAILSSYPSPGDTIVSIIFPAFTSGTLSVKANNACGSGAIKSITVKGTPETPGNIAGNTSPCSGTIQVYNISNIPGATSYQWTVPSGSVKISGASTNSVTVLIGNTGGNILVKAKNACGTGSSKSLNITVPCRLNYITANDEFNWNIAPNPTHASIEIIFYGLKEENATIILKDSQGKQLKETRLICIKGTNQLQLDLSQYPPGVYVVQFISDQITKIHKVVKQ